MPVTLIQNARWGDGTLDVLVDDDRIAALGAQLDVPATAEVFDATGLVLWPGMVNTHHHLAQSILKGMPSGIDADLNAWLPAVPFSAWPHFDPETLYAAALVGFTELLRSGCTTCADHHYLYQQHMGPELEEALLEAAAAVGIRFVLCRGGATTAGSHLGLSDAPIKNEPIETMLERLKDTLHRWHDPSPYSMRRLVVAPTSLVHGCEPAHLKELGAFAREHGLKRHSHLLEVVRDEEVAQAKYAKSAINYAEEAGWLGDDVWYAHLVHVDDRALAKLAETRTGIAHCPTSNCRLGSGVSPVPAMARAGVPVSIGVDGSASAESGSMANEAMLAWLLHRAVGGADATTLGEVQVWCTEGGADILGLDTGRIRVGACADLVFYDVSHPRYAGVWQPGFAPVLCGEPVKVARAMVNGQWRVFNGEVPGFGAVSVAEQAGRQLKRLQNRMNA